MTKRNSDCTQFRNIHRIFGNCQFHDLSLRPQLRLSSTAYRLSANHPCRTPITMSMPFYADMQLLLALTRLPYGTNYLTIPTTNAVGGL